MDEDVVEIENVENVCRLCLSTDEPRSSVFTTDKEEDDTAVSLAVKIKACLSIEVGARLRSFVLCESRGLEGSTNRFHRDCTRRTLLECASPTRFEVMFVLRGDAKISVMRGQVVSLAEQRLS